jgi:phosphoglycerate dehydrogenase-like enzyme
VSDGDRVCVLSHLGGAAAVGLPDDLADQVDVVPVPMHGPAGDDVRGEVLVSVPGWGENTADLLGRGVRWMHFVATGIDGVRLDELPEGLILTNSRGASAVPIAEWVLAVMLAFEKRLPDTWIDAPPDNWRADPHLGTLQGKTVAIIGFGSIGRAVAERARPFGMTIRALRRTAGASGMDGIEPVESVAAALDGADHVVLAAPLTPATRHLIDQDAFAAMKPGVHLVNIARGGLVDQDALRAALDDGTVSTASLDTVDPEPLPAGHWMFAHPGVRLSAHDSWSWPGAYRVMLDRFIVNLRVYLDGGPLPDLIDRQVGY